MFFALKISIFQYSNIFFAVMVYHEKSNRLYQSQTSDKSDENSSSCGFWTTFKEICQIVFICTEIILLFVKTRHERSRKENSRFVMYLLLLWMSIIPIGKLHWLVRPFFELTQMFIELNNTMIIELQFYL